MEKVTRSVLVGVLAVLAGWPAAAAKGLFAKAEEAGFEGKVVLLRIGEQDLMSK